MPRDFGRLPGKYEERISVERNFMRRSYGATSFLPKKTNNEGLDCVPTLYSSLGRTVFYRN